MESIIEYIEGRYDPENDAGKVTWVDMRLLSIIEQLVKKVKKMEQKIEALEAAEQERDEAEALGFSVELYRR